MSTTRKIEGFGANRFGEYQFDVAPDENDGWEPATLIIGGKGYTEEEHEAEFQRRAKAMLDDMRRMFRPGSEGNKPTIDRMFVDEFSAILRSHNIKP